MMTMNRFHRLVWVGLVVTTLVIVALVEPIRAMEGEKPTEGSFSGTPQSSGEKAESEAKSATTTDENNQTQQQEQQQSELPRRPKEVIEDSFDANSRDWGSYYDPQNVFCGKYDCYKILGFDYDAFGKNPPDTKVITKRYRKLSRIWHPDKSKHRDAKDRFVKIARAYEVLTDIAVRKEYDSMRFDQAAYFKKYGTSIFWHYAPQSDVTLVLLLIFTVANVAMWYSQHHRWQLVANRLIKAAVEDWSTAQGGTPESRALREDALAILKEKQEKEAAAEAAAAAPNTNGTTASDKTTTTTTNGKKASPAATNSAGAAAAAAAAAAVNKKQKGAKKLSAREKKKLEEEAILPIVQGLVYEMHDFGAGFHKPTWKDLLIVTLARAPIALAQAVVWNAGYALRRLQKLELNDEEKMVLTQRAVGPVVWATQGEGASEEDRQALIRRQLWIAANKAEWEEEQRIRNLSSAEQKQYAKLKKKGKVE